MSNDEADNSDDGQSNKSDERCEEAIRQFAEITDTDEAFAHCFLQDVNFDLDLALTKYFASQQAEGSSADVLDAATTNTMTITTTTETIKTVQVELEGKAEQPPKKKVRKDEEFPAELTMISWNVDATDHVALHTRFTSVLYIIARLNPEVIFLQEMTNEVMSKLNELMEKMYNIYISDATFPYFCVMLVSKNIEIERHEIIEFTGEGATKMGRTAILVEAYWQKLKLKLINTHLESMKEHSKIRSNQFQQCMDKLKEVASIDEANTLAIFGGDLNIRENEVLPLPGNVHDAWQAAGAKNMDKFSWDMVRNDNHPAVKGRARFDRIFFTGPYAGVDFSLHGTQRIRAVHCFPSDHFGISCRFYNLLGALPTPLERDS